MKTDKKKIKAGIVGYGVVGKGIHRVLKDDVVAIYDPNGYDDKKKFKDLDLVVICVMTKENDDGSCDTSIVEESIDWVYAENPDAVILVKSAVVPSEIDRIYKKYSRTIRLVVSPEYMGESRYFTPEWKYPHPERMESHTWQVFGGFQRDTSFVVDVFKKHMGVDTVFFQTDLMTASLCKYMENSFFALKVTFCNEWFELAEAMGIDYNTLREAWLLDPRINKNHTLVFPDNRGYGGKCFPKDVKAIIKDAENYDCSMDLMKAVDERNKKFRKLND